MMHKAVLLIAIPLILVLLLLGKATESTQAALSFQIVDVRAEYGHLLVEVQHFHPDASHWFFEHYVFQGREQYKNPRIVDENGRLFLKRDSSKAPQKENFLGQTVSYLPEGEDWLRSNRPYLDKDSVLSVVQQIHNKRLRTGYSKGKLRLNSHPLDFTVEDSDGAPYLVALLKDTLLSQTFLIGDNNTLTAMGPRAPPNIPYGTEFGTTSTFYPDTAPETTSVDGYAGRAQANETWATIRGGAGEGANSDDTDSANLVKIETESTSGEWDHISRTAVTFDSSALGDSDIIDSATFDFVATNDVETLTGQSVTIVDVALDVATEVDEGDYGNFGTTAQATAFTIAGLTVDSSTYTVTDLNAAGLATISKTGISDYGMLVESDRSGTEPTWVDSVEARLQFASAEEVVAGDKRPRLVVEHTTPSAAITGTIGDGATEQEVRDGGGTIIITLTGATWIADISAQRQAIINGVDSAQSETAGWDAEVKAKIGLGSVVRTSGTVVTITLTASEVAGYLVDSNETLTVTVPNAAISISGDLTGSPTVTLTAAAESVATTGTLSDDATPAQIRAGSETLIQTLTNTKWRPAGADFNAQRRNILDALVSDLSDQNGWDIRKEDFAVGDVARTSDTIITITLSASASYAIPTTETITAAVPASALVFDAALTGGTFTIVPSFQASGNHVSAALDLTSVNDVAYCGIGWNSTTPTNTTVTVETSINGGSSYSTATNGSCPAGISIGDSLSSLNDFRVKITLTTTTSTSTPTISDVGVVIADVSGHTLFYRLLEPPAAQMPDQSGNSNTSSYMSLPVAPSGYTTTTQGTVPNAEAELAESEAPTTQEVAAAAGAITNWATGETGSALPLYDYFLFIAGRTDVPIGAFLIMLAMVGVIFSMVIVYYSTRSVAAAYLAGIFSIISFTLVGVGILPWWMVFTFAFTTGTFVFYRRASI